MENNRNTAVGDHARALRELRAGNARGAELRLRALQSAGLGELHTHDFISARIQGVTPEFVEKVRSHGFKNLTIRQLINLKMADVF